MAVNLKELAKNEFWMKKLRTEARVRDTNKDGYVSKADYDIVLQRYKDLGTPESHLKKLEHHHNLLCGALGIVDNTVQLTYDQCIENFTNCSQQLEEILKIFTIHFEIIDTNQDGEISFQEWINHHKALGIDTSHARGSFDAMDTNSDGVVSMEEFVAFCKEFYATAEDKLHSSLLLGPLEN